MEVLAKHEVRREIRRRPSLAQGWRIGSELHKHFADRLALTHVDGLGHAGAIGVRTCSAKKSSVRRHASADADASYARP